METCLEPLTSKALTEWLENHPMDGETRAFIELAAMKAAEHAMEKFEVRLKDHIDNCPGKRNVEIALTRLDRHDTRIKVIELSRAKLLGVMIGAGAIGGSVSEIFAKMFGG